MFAKAIGLFALVLLPMSVSLWHRSHSFPQQHRYDITLYKSLRVYLRDGVCGLHLLSMPTKTASRSEDFNSLTYDPRPAKRMVLFSSSVNGKYRNTWLVFPLWLLIGGLSIGGGLPFLVQPAKRWYRRRNGLCLHCGYNLTGSRAGRCPECGAHGRDPRGRDRRTASRAPARARHS